MQTLLLVLIAALLISLLCLILRLLKMCNEIKFEAIRLGWEFAFFNNKSSAKQGNNRLE